MITITKDGIAEFQRIALDPAQVILTEADATDADTRLALLYRRLRLSTPMELEEERAGPENRSSGSSSSRTASLFS
jgi:hypothetical protein